MCLASHWWRMVLNRMVVAHNSLVKAVIAHTQKTSQLMEATMMCRTWEALKCSVNLRIRSDLLAKLGMLRLLVAAGLSLLRKVWFWKASACHYQLMQSLSKLSQLRTESLAVLVAIFTSIRRTSTCLTSWMRIFMLRLKEASEPMEGQAAL